MSIFRKIIQKILSTFRKGSEADGGQKMKIVEIGHTGDLRKVLNKCDLVFLQDVSSGAYIIFCRDKKCRELLENADDAERDRIRKYQGFKIHGQMDKVIQRLEEIFGKKIELG